MNVKSKKIADHLVKEHKNGIDFSNLSGSLRPSDFTEAYDAQFFFQEQIKRGNLGGYKIALSSKVQQEFHKINQPVFGGIFIDEIYASPKQINQADYRRLSIECELAFQLSDQLESFSDEINFSNINNMISKVFPVLELVEDRRAEYDGLDALSLACDNAWSGGLVVGNEIKNWRTIDFKTLNSTCFWNDEPFISTPVMEADPFNNLCWIINNLKERRCQLKKTPNFKSESRRDPRVPVVPNKPMSSLTC
jgi:2-keto-4-pentenoate hydratase